MTAIRHDEPTPPPAPAPVTQASRDDLDGMPMWKPVEPAAAPDEAAKWDLVTDKYLRESTAKPHPIDAQGIRPEVHGVKAAVAKAIALGLAAPADRAVEINDAMVRSALVAWQDTHDPYDKASDASTMRRAIGAALRAAPAGADTEGEPRRKVSAGRDMDDKPDGGY